MVDWDNPEVAELKRALGEAVVGDLARACREREEHNASGSYKVHLPWLVDSAAWEGWAKVARDELGRMVVPGRKAELEECVAYLRNVVSVLVERATWLKSVVVNKSNEIQGLKKALEEKTKELNIEAGRRGARAATGGARSRRNAKRL